MIKLFTDQSYLSPENRTVVFPLLFDLWYSPNSNLLQKYKLVDRIESCDIAVVPVDLAHFGNEKTFQNFVSKAFLYNKLVWVYSAGDYGRSLKQNVFTFRHGGFDSKLNDRTFVLPSFISDPLRGRENQFKPLKKCSKPKIGFVGHANNSLQKQLKERLSFLKYHLQLATHRLRTDVQDFYPSSSERFRCLQLLENDKRIDSNFIFRKKYNGGFNNQEEKEKFGQQFFQNIEQTPYTFCLRGAGNFSVRFYETLAMGRIPFVIDTDFRLPLNQLIYWEKHCVIASEHNIVESLLAFHNRISDECFINMQLNNRKIWLDFLEREAYFVQIYTVFKKLVNEV